MACFLSRNCWLENAISILLGNLNSGRSYPITALNSFFHHSIVQLSQVWSENSHYQSGLSSCYCWVWCVDFGGWPDLKKEHVPTWCTRTQMSINNASTPCYVKTDGKKIGFDLDNFLKKQPSPFLSSLKCQDNF